jgi:histidine triad (HIT) family protein
MKTIVEKIVHRETPAAIVYESEQVIAFMDHDPINHGHVLICPVFPYADLIDLPQTVLSEILEVAKQLYRRIEEKYAPTGISFIQNNGANNELSHFHLHIFPRFQEDGFGWTSNDLGIQTVEGLKEESKGLVL